MPQYEVTLGIRVRVEADDEWDAAVEAAKQHGGKVISVSRAGRGRPSGATAKRAKPVKNRALAAKAKARWLPGGDLRKAADARKKAAAKKATAKKATTKKR